MEKLRKVSEKTAREFAKAIIGVNAEMEKVDEIGFRFSTGLLSVEVFDIILDNIKYPYALLYIDSECRDSFNFVNGEALRVEDKEADE